MAVGDERVCGVAFNAEAAEDAEISAEKTKRGALGGDAGSPPSSGFENAERNWLVGTLAGMFGVSVVYVILHSIAAPGGEERGLVRCILRGRCFARSVLIGLGRWGRLLRLPRLFCLSGFGGLGRRFDFDCGGGILGWKVRLRGSGGAVLFGLVFGFAGSGAAAAGSHDGILCVPAGDRALLAGRMGCGGGVSNT